MSEQTNEAIALAELQKLNLEIEHLRNKSKWSDRIAPFTNLLSIIIAVFGFLFGIYQFQKQQQAMNQQLIFEQEKHRLALDREHETKLQDQIRSDVEQLLQFPKEKDLTLSKVAFLLSDLKNGIENKYRGRADAATATKETVREISTMLSMAVVNECDFDEDRNVRFLAALMNQWIDYEDYLKEDTDEIEFLLDKYAEAINRIYKADPAVIRHVSYEADHEIFNYVEGAGKLDYATRAHFQALVMGFARAYDLLKDKKASEWLAIKFQASTCNPTLTKQLLEIEFSRQTTSEFGGCS
jgi:hypothetical protein